MNGGYIVSYEEIIKWLLEGDISIQYQVHRDLLGSDLKTIEALKNRILHEGWARQFLDKKEANGHWGRGFYQPKWISSHYTLLDLKHLEVPLTEGISKTINTILSENKSNDGGIDPHREIAQSDVCVNGMFLNYACYFGVDEKGLHSVVDYIINEQMSDGGFNCRKVRSGASHSSVHSTIAILEGLHEYFNNGYTYRLNELEQIRDDSERFMLEHHLYKSDKTGEVMHKSMTMLSYPSRWKYDVLRGLAFFEKAQRPYDKRMEDGIALIFKKRLKNGLWPVQAKHTGLVHFDMEQTGKASRWNTLRALRVLKMYAAEKL